MNIIRFYYISPNLTVYRIYNGNNYRRKRKNRYNKNHTLNKLVLKKIVQLRFMFTFSKMASQQVNVNCKKKQLIS